MRILDELRGHFALLTKRKFKTLSEEAPFVITRVVSTSKRQSEWIVVVRPLTGKNDIRIYISDMLQVYSWMMNNRWEQWTTLKDIQGVIDKSRINLAQTSYLMALMATFDDIESRRGEDAAIRLVTHREEYGMSVE